MSQLSSSPVLTDESRPHQSQAYDSRPTRHLGDEDQPFLITQPGERLSTDMPSLRVCSAPSLSTRWHTRRSTSDDEAGAATPTHPPRTRVASSHDEPTATTTMTTSAITTSRRAATGRGSDGEAASSNATNSTTHPDHTSSTRASLRDVGCEARADSRHLTTNAINTTTTSSSSSSALVEAVPVTHVNVSLHHPVVHFLSGVQLQGFAEHLIGACEIHTMEELLNLARNEALAGALLGDAASRQHKLDFWKGLQRWQRDAAREEKRQARESLKTRKRPRERQSGRGAGKAAEPTAPLAVTHHAFSLDRLCDELLADSHDLAPYRPARDDGDNDDDDDGGEAESSRSARVASASQLMRALTLSDEDIVALRARRHTREPPRLPPIAATQSNTQYTETVVVDVDAESLSDQDEKDNNDESPSDDDDGSTSQESPPQDDHAPCVTASPPMTLTASSTVSDALCSLIAETCHAKVAGLARPNCHADGAVCEDARVPALHRPNETVSLCALYRRSASLSCRLTPQEARDARQSPQLDAHEDPLAGACDAESSQDQPESSVPTPTDAQHTDGVATQAKAVALREELESAVAHLVSQYNVAMAALREIYHMDHQHTPAWAVPNWLQPVTATIAERCEQDGGPTAPQSLLSGGTATTTTTTTTTAAVVSPAALEPCRSHSVVEATAPAGRRALWSVHVNNQWGCHGASDADDDHHDREVTQCGSQDLMTGASQTTTFVPSEPSPELLPVDPRPADADGEQTVLTPPAMTSQAVAEPLSPSPAPPQSSPRPSQTTSPLVVAGTRDGVPRPSSQCSPTQRSSDMFWETFGLDALDGTDGALSHERAAVTPAPQTPTPIDVDEEFSTSSSVSGGPDDAPTTNRDLSRDLLPQPDRGVTAHEPAPPPLPPPQQKTTAADSESDAAVRWLLAHGLDDETLHGLSLEALRTRCAWLGLRVPPPHQEAPVDVTAMSGSSEPSSIPLDRFGLHSLNDDEADGMAVAATQLDAGQGKHLLAGGSLSRSTSPPPRPRPENGSVHGSRSPCSAGSPQQLARSAQRSRKRPHREEVAEAHLIELDDLREQLRLAAVRARFERIVCPSVLHRVTRFSGLPYHRLKAADLVQSDACLTADDLERARQAAKVEEHAELWRCTLSALAADAFERLETHAETHATTATTVPPLNKLLLLEPLDCDEVTALVQRDFGHITRGRVRQFIVDSGVSLEVVDTVAAPASPQIAVGGADQDLGSPPRAHNTTSSSPRGATSPSPEQTRRANARNYFATRGMPVRGGRHGFGRGRGRGRGGRGRGAAPHRQ